MQARVLLRKRTCTFLNVQSEHSLNMEVMRVFIRENKNDVSGFNISGKVYDVGFQPLKCFWKGDGILSCFSAFP